MTDIVVYAATAHHLLETYQTLKKMSVARKEQREAALQKVINSDPHKFLANQLSMSLQAAGVLRVPFSVVFMTTSLNIHPRQTNLANMGITNTAGQHLLQQRGISTVINLCLDDVSAAITGLATALGAQFRRTVVHGGDHFFIDFAAPDIHWSLTALPPTFKSVRVLNLDRTWADPIFSNPLMLDDDYDVSTSSKFHQFANTYEYLIASGHHWVLIHLLMYKNDDFPDANRVVVCGVVRGGSGNLTPLSSVTVHLNGAPLMTPSLSYIAGGCFKIEFEIAAVTFVEAAVQIDPSNHRFDSTRLVL